MDFRNKLIRQVADEACESIVQTVISYLQTFKGSGIYHEDIELKDKWEEFCVQVQFDESIEWELVTVQGGSPGFEDFA